MMTKETAKGIIKAISDYESCERAITALREIKGSAKLVFFNDEGAERIRHIVEIKNELAKETLQKQLTTLGLICDYMNDQARGEVMS